MMGRSQRAECVLMMFLNMPLPSVVKPSNSSAATNVYKKQVLSRGVCLTRQNPYSNSVKNGRVVAIILPVSNTHFRDHEKESLLVCFLQLSNQHTIHT